MFRNYRNDCRAILVLIHDIKYNPNHDARGRFSRTSEAHWIVSRDGMRTLGPKHPNHPDNLFTPAQKLANALHEKYPKVAFNFDKIDPAFVPRMAAHFDALLTAYPDVAEHARFIGTLSDTTDSAFYTTADGKYASGDNSYAYASYFTSAVPGQYWSAMVVNPKYFKSEKTAASMLANDNKSGWHPNGADDPLSILTHEFGHLVHYNLLYGGRGKAMPGLDFIGKKNNEGEVSRMTQYWNNEHTADGYQISRYASTTYDKNKESGLKEMLAEGFAQMYHTPEAQWKPFTHSLKSFLATMGSSSSWNSKPRSVDFSKDTISAGKAKQKINAISKLLRKSRQTSILPPLDQEEVTLVDLTPHTEIEDGGKGYGPEEEK